MKRMLVLCMLIFTGFSLFGCNNISIERYNVKFDLKKELNVEMPYVTLISTADEFGEFTNNSLLFDETLSDEFVEFNKRFTDLFFEDSFLIPVIYSGSSSIEKVTVKKTKVIDGLLQIYLKVKSPKNVTADLVYYTFYLSVPKNTKIKDVNIIKLA